MTNKDIYNQANKCTTREKERKPTLNFLYKDFSLLLRQNSKKVTPKLRKESFITFILNDIRQSKKR